ncbi:HTH-type transcriptional regulator NmtR [Planctomycetales bacterium 10988]|nr:HTH-type transcriptional regulator NmtR [Planctomycetales bacterium 10988]
MRQKQEFEECASRLKSLADPERLRIVLSLFEGGEKSVSQLATDLGDEIVKISHHLGVLRNAGVVLAKKDGRYVYYQVHPDVIPEGSPQGEIRKIHFGCCSIDLHNEK